MASQAEYKSRLALKWIRRILAVAFLYITIALVIIQVLQSSELSAEATARRTYSSTLPAVRGDIVDSKGTVLATTEQTYHIWVNQKNVKKAKLWEEQADETWKVTGSGPAIVAEKLAPLLEMNEAELGGKLIGNETYVVLKKNVSIETWRKIRAFKFYGIEWESSSKRIYPGKSDAASVLGAVRADGIGVGGIEGTQEEYLKGKDGHISNEYSPFGQVIPGSNTELVNPENGRTVHLTLDIDLQHRIEELLNQVAARHKPQAASVVITEVKTGNILVLADAYNKPITTEPQTSKAVQYAAEPGSVGKVYTMAAGLEKKVITPLSPIPVPYVYTAPNGQTIKDAEPHGYQVLTAAGVLANSSNTGTVYVGSQVSDEERYDLKKRLGLGRPTNIGLPGESAGFLPEPSTWDGRQRYVNMFGQAYSVNQLQLVNSFATIGNGGAYLPLRLIDGYTLPDGTYEKVPLQPATRALEPQVAADLLRMMETVSAAGSGSFFQVPGYRAALKTGTAEIIEGGRYVGNSLNITGVVPVQDPELAIAVHMYRPNFNTYSTVLLSDLFKNTLSEAVRARNIPASDLPPQPYPIHAK